MPKNTTTLGPADEALIAAEREIAALRQKQADFIAAGDHGDHDELSTKLFALVTRIAKTAPDSLIGAAVKLRMLADESTGIEEASNGEGDAESVRQILAAVERSVALASDRDEKAVDEGRNDLENALASFEGISAILRELGDTGEAEHLAYLGHQLHDHYNEAYDAFARIFGLDAEGGVA